ncbi:MAG: molybdenum cofactor guanylyltransferase [Planctomycetia bacterium]|jgi:molybdopterin-guanine dinucleotide biosynthesis protein A
MRPDAISIVLAGGRGRRLGATAPPGGKAAVQFRGRSFLEIVIAAVGAETGRVVVVAAPGQELPPLPADVFVVRDALPGAGPLAAVRDGLMAADRLGPGFGAAFVASCDLPLLRRTVVRAILDRQRTQHPAWVVPLVNGHPQPLASALPFTLLPRIERHLCAGRRDLRSLLATLAAEPTAAIDFLPAAALTAADPEGESFRDVDTAEEVARLNEAANPPSAG